MLCNSLKRFFLLLVDFLKSSPSILGDNWLGLFYYTDGSFAAIKKLALSSKI